MRLFLSLVLALSALPAFAQEAASDLMLILDASGSMWGQVEGKNKIVIARETLAELTDELPAGMELGLVAYGHRREGDCADIETIAAMGALDRAGLVSTVNAINPKGKTPITASIEKAVAAVEAHGEATTVVLLSDGLETCGGDPCAAVRKAKQAGANFLLHVIGFDLGKESAATLECAAQAGGGLYFDAKNAAELSAALGEAVAKAEEEPADSALSVKAIRNGELTDVLVLVEDSAGDVVGNGRTYRAAGTNPRVIPLAAGTYRVRVKALGFKGASEVIFSELIVPAGETVEKTVDFTTGKISVKATRNGALSDGLIHVTDAAGRAADAGRTYRHAKTNPLVIELTPGSYSVDLKALEIKNNPTQTWREVVVKPGETVAFEQEFPSGELRIGSTVGGAPHDSVVKVRSADGKWSAGGRTYVAPKTNPRSFILTPGKYTVTVKPLRLEGNPQEAFEVEVAGGGSVERIVEF